MVKIVLIRPGSTDYDEEGRIQGTLNVPLNEQGNAEVARAIEELRDLKLEAIYAPPSQPAWETAEAIAKARGLKVRKLERMQNLNQGLWQGMRIDEVRRKQPKVYRQWQDTPQMVCPPEGEMLAEAEQRVKVAMTKLLKRHREGCIGLVVPEPLASLVRRFVSHGELGDLWKAAGQHGRWEILEVEPTALAQSG
ncbi:MAG TPA: histidine phosphatase family protein [Planctomycetaceae bacterium]|nr:histidine phosphatase family protein [Planctomycetaceae bacterium]HIQ20252.1 histidine phosphatase family protein [Planctomycetota bacterium]